MAEILLTGATGFLGKVVLHELLRRREELGVERVHAVVRDRKGVPAGERFRSAVLGSPCFSRLPEGWAELVAPVEADLARPGHRLPDETRRALAGRLTHVIHCAASVEFHLPLAEAAAANATAALYVLELARECPRLRSMVDVSTAYATPHPGRDTPVEEVLAPLRRPAAETYGAILAGGYDHPDDQAGLLAETGHPNTYTLTKCLAEHLLAERRGRVPLTLVRPSIITASFREPFPGWIDSPAAFALFAMMVATGRMRALIARPDARLDVIPVDAVADRVIAAAFDPPAPDEPLRIRHAVAGPELSPSLGACAQRVETFFRRNPVDGGRGPVARLGYIGPDGLRYRIHHLFQHRVRRHARPVAARLSETNRLFAYFTHNTFRFRSSVPFRETGFEMESYLDEVCRGIYRHLLDGDEAEVPLAGRGHKRARGDFWWALLQPQGSFFIRLSAWAVAKALRRGVDRVSVDVESFRDALAATPREATRVVAPSHRSYLDFVLVSFLCFARPDLGLAIPHVAAAVEFARIPVLGWLFKRLHAFYLERGRGREDKALTQTIHGLVHGGATLEFFVEGRRSRSRRFLPPRRGFLRSLQATGRSVALLPVAISYDHVPEEETLTLELRGAAKPPMRLRDLLGWTGRLLRGRIELGRIHMACGRPVLMDLRSDVREVGGRVMGELQARTVTTTHPLRAFLARADADGVDLPWLVEALERRGGRVLEAPRREIPVPDLMERCMRYQFIHLFYPEAALAFAGNPAVEHHIRRNGWAPGPPLDPEAELADARVRAVLRALFEPVRRDYAAAASALAVRWANASAGGSGGAAAQLGAGLGVPCPADLLGGLPGAHLPDLEGAYEDLAERGILLREAGADGFAWGPRASDVAGYAALCARSPLDAEPL